MMPNVEQPYGMLIEKAQNIRALADAEEKKAKNHDTHAAECRTLAVSLSAKAKTFEDAAKAIKAVEDEAARLALKRSA